MAAVAAAALTETASASGVRCTTPLPLLPPLLLCRRYQRQLLAQKLCTLCHCHRLLQQRRRRSEKRRVTAAAAATATDCRSSPSLTLCDGVLAVMSVSAVLAAKQFLPLLLLLPLL